MSDYVGSLRQLADLMTVDLPIVPNDIEQRLRDAADELERITQLAIDRQGEIIALNDAMALQREQDGDEISKLAELRRIDKSGRDVTDLPGLWDESDRVVMAAETVETIGSLTAERDRNAAAYESFHFFHDSPLTHHATMDYVI